MPDDFFYESKDKLLKSLDSDIMDSNLIYFFFLGLISFIVVCFWEGFLWWGLLIKGLIILKEIL
jgi:hypothetical protein